MRTDWSRTDKGTFSSADIVKCLYILSALIYLSCPLSAAGARINLLPSSHLTPLPQTRFDPDGDLAQARQSEELGRLDEAIGLYERVLRLRADDATALSALPRLYIKQGRFESAIQMLESQIERSPKNVVYRRMVADVYFNINREADGREQCEAILRFYPENEAMYRVVSAIYRDRRMFVDAAETLVRGRRALKKPELYTRSLADLYTTLGDGAAAAGEYLTLVDNQPRQFQIVDDRIEQLFEIQGDAPILAVLTERSRSRSPSVETLKLLGNYHIRRERPDEALEQYLKADAQGDDDGALLLEFAELVLREGHNAAAISAYQGLMERTLSDQIARSASLGLADALLASDQINEATAAYGLVKKRYPGTPEGWEADNRIGELLLTRYGDPTGALKIFKRLAASPLDPARRVPIQFRIAECHLARGSIEDAVAQYEAILDPAAPDPRDPDAIVRARYRLAELSLFQGELETAAETFTGIAEENPSSQYANDALQWSLLLGANTQLEPMSVYARAILLHRQYRPEAALDAYKSILNDFPEAGICDLAILSVAGILDEIGKPHESIAAYRDLLNRYPASRHAPEAQERIARVFEKKLRDIPTAITEYQALLVNYPAEFGNDAIRRRIRVLAAPAPRHRDS